MVVLVLISGLYFGISREIDGTEARLNAQIGQAEARLDARIDRLETKLDRFIESVDTRLRATENNQSRLDGIVAALLAGESP